MMFENRVEGTMPERHVSGRSGIVDTVLRVLRHCGEGSIIVRTCLPSLGGVARRKNRIPLFHVDSRVALYFENTILFDLPPGF